MDGVPCGPSAQSAGQEAGQPDSAVRGRRPDPRGVLRAGQREPSLALKHAQGQRR